MAKIKKQAIPAVRSIKVPKADLIKREADTHVMGGGDFDVGVNKARGINMKKRPFKHKKSMMK